MNGHLGGMQAGSYNETRLINIYMQAGSYDRTGLMNVCMQAGSHDEACLMNMCRPGHAMRLSS